MSGERNPTGRANQQPEESSVPSGATGAPASAAGDRAYPRAILDRAGIGIARLNLEGRLLESNQALERMLGYRGQALRRRPFAEMLHPADREAALRHLGPGAVPARSGPVIEVRFLRKDGGLAWGRLTALAVPASDGDPATVVLLVQETTDRRRAEEALRNTAQRSTRSRKSFSRPTPPE
jgi:PAS domain S-box-containing protein